MVDWIDLEFICNNLGNLSGMPVRMFDENEQVLYYSIVTLPKDPFLPYKNDILLKTEHVCYFIAPHNYFYGIVNFENKKIIVGPTRQIPISDQEIKEIAFETDVPHDTIADFVNGMKSIIQMPLTSVLQMLTNVNHILNNGEKLSIKDLAIYDYEQEKMSNLFEYEDVTRTINNIDLNNNVTYSHNTMSVENFILSAVKNGDIDGLNDYFSKIPAVRMGILAHDELRQAKNILISTATLLSREVINAGMDIDESLTLMDSYVQKSELLQDTLHVTNLTYRLIMDYAERMNRRRYGDKSSKLVNSIINYVRHHLSEPITVEDIAHYLKKGRSRLSTDFKKETGESLSIFILKIKIQEAQRLLRYTDKPLIEIALFLGFSSQSHFSRTFKQYTSITPFEFRNKI